MVLAADVVYDVRYHGALVGVVAEALRRRPDALVVFASTVSMGESGRPAGRREATTHVYAVFFPNPCQNIRRCAEGDGETGHRIPRRAATHVELAVV